MKNNRPSPSIHAVSELELIRRARDVRAEKTLDSLLEPKKATANDGQGLHQFSISFAEAYEGLYDAGNKVNVAGVALHYRKRFSAPGGLVDVVIGQKIFRMAPGDTIRAPFTGLVFFASSGAPFVGSAYFVIEQREDVRFVEELSNPSGVPFPPILIGGTLTQPLVLETNLGAPAALPSAVSESFDVRGFKKLRVRVSNWGASPPPALEDIEWRVYFSAYAADGFPDFDPIEWAAALGQSPVIPRSSEVQVFTFDVNAWGYLYLAPQATTSTEVTFLVWGIE